MHKIYKNRFGYMSEHLNHTEKSDYFKLKESYEDEFLVIYQAAKTKPTKI